MTSSIGFYILAWLPLLVIVIFAIKGILKKKVDKEK
jgi:hypothetical protein